MGDAANPTGDRPGGQQARGAEGPEAAATMREVAAALAGAVEQHVAGWAAACVTRRWREWRGAAPPPDVEAAATRAGEAVRELALPALRRLLEADVHDQRTNPLSILRSSVGPVTAALREVGVPPVERDEQAQRIFPEDDYDVGPAAFADLGPAVHEAGIAWGAAKAHVVLTRRRHQQP